MGISCALIAMDIDKVCFKRSKTQDYKLEERVHPPEAISKHMIDYVVKLLLKENMVLHPGHEIVARTACIIGSIIPEFCLHIKKSKNIPLTLLSEGYISELFSGRLLVKFAFIRAKQSIFVEALKLVLLS